MASDIDDRRTRVMRFLEQVVWPAMPQAEMGRRISRAEEDELLGYGPDGVTLPINGDPREPELPA